MTDSDILVLWNKLGVLSVDLDNYHLAIQCFQNSLKLNHYNFNTLLELCRCCNHFHDQVEIQLLEVDNIIQTLHYVNNFLQQLESDPGRFDAVDLNLLFYQVARLYYNVGDFDHALQIITNNVAHPHPDCLILRALVHLKLGQADEFVAILRLLAPGPAPLPAPPISAPFVAPLVAPLPDQLIKVYTLLGLYYRDQNQLAVAAGWFRLGLDIIGLHDQDLYYNVGLLHIATSDVAQALQTTDKALLYHPNHYGLWLLKAHGLMLARDHAASSQILDHIVSFKHANTDLMPWILLGYNHIVLAHFTQAFDCLQVCLLKSSKVSLVWLLIGNLYLQLGQLPDSLLAYSQALRLTPEDFGLSLALAWDGLSCVYERCENQLMDAIGACTRAANCFNQVGDLAHHQLFVDRAAYLKANVDALDQISLRDPIAVPPELFNDLIRLPLIDRIKLNDAVAQDGGQPGQSPSEPSPISASATPRARAGAGLNTPTASLELSKSHQSYMLPKVDAAPSDSATGSAKPEATPAKSGAKSSPNVKETGVKQENTPSVASAVPSSVRPAYGSHPHTPHSMPAPPTNYFLAPLPPHPGPPGSSPHGQSPHPAFPGPPLGYPPHHGYMPSMGPPMGPPMVPPMGPPGGPPGGPMPPPPLGPMAGPLGPPPPGFHGPPPPHEYHGPMPPPLLVNGYYNGYGYWKK